MTKYKNKDGIELSYDGHEDDSHANLVKEVLKQAVKLINSGAEKDKVIEFLTENFSLNVEED
jgi:IS4 transposase|tara:strand:- start:111 stop:296 length:186 start_codon:yes stop_codon:yes gene_type:complete